MKRLTYISSFSRPLGKDEIDQIAAKSIENNSRDGLTGVLFCFNNIFYQILEGDEQMLDKCYARILSDNRHNNIFCLEIEKDIKERYYADWAMKTVRLEESNDSLIMPVRTMLNSLAKTHYILERYSPQIILNGIQQGENPLEWEPFNAERIVLFSDIMASTTLTESNSVEAMSLLLRTYYEICNRVITQSGGVISKLTGDGIMAYFTWDEADKAIEAAATILKELQAVRKAHSPNDIRNLLYAGIGLAGGKVREGNIGSELKKDYTLLGDAVNTAARLEAVTRKVRYALVFDTSIVHRLNKAYNLKKLGKYQPKGKTEMLDLFTLDEPYIKMVSSHGSLKDRIISAPKS